MRIVGLILCGASLAWLLLGQLAAIFPKAGNYSERVKRLPQQDSFTRQQVRDVIWEVSASRWSLPDQETYTREQVTNMLFTTSMTSPRDFPPPSVGAPVTLLVTGAFIFGLGLRKKDAKPAA